MDNMTDENAEKNTLSMFDVLAVQMQRGRVYKSLLMALADTIREVLPGLAGMIDEQIATVEAWDGKSSISDSLVSKAVARLGHGKN